MRADPNRRLRRTSRTAARESLELGDVVGEQLAQPLAQRGGQLGLRRRALARVVDDPLDHPAQRLGQAVEVAIERAQPGRRTARSMSRKPPSCLPLPVSHSRSNCSESKSGSTPQNSNTRRIVAARLVRQVLALSTISTRSAPNASR